MRLPQMIFKWIKKHLPTAEEIKKNKHLSWISSKLKSRPYLWRFTKHSVAGGVAVSMLVAFVPLPLEMLLAALLALLCRVNLPVAVLATWLTNPITFIPANYLIYKTGSLFVANGTNDFPQVKFKFNWHSIARSSEELLTWLGSLGKVYLIGFPIVSISAAILGYVVVYIGWTIYDLLSSKTRH